MPAAHRQRQLLHQGGRPGTWGNLGLWADGGDTPDLIATTDYAGACRALALAVGVVGVGMMALLVHHHDALEPREQGEPHRIQRTFGFGQGRRHRGRLGRRDAGLLGTVAQVLDGATVLLAVARAGEVHRALGRGHARQALDQHLLHAVELVAAGRDQPARQRLHHLPQVVLGMAFGWGIPMAFAAVTGSVPALAWLLYAANIVWSVAYDTFYAMTDRDDDLKIGVKSSAILFGARDLQIVAALQGLFLLLLALCGVLAGCGPVYYLGLFAATWLMVWEQYLVRKREPAACFRAFLHNNWVGLAVYAGVLVDALP